MSRQSFLVFRDDSDSEHSEFEEFTQKRLKLVTCFCLYIINLRPHPRVGSTRRPKQKPKSPPCRRRPTINFTRKTGVSKMDGHGTNAPIADKNIAEQENADASQFPGTFSFSNKPLPGIPEAERRVLQPSAQQLGLQKSTNSSKLPMTEAHGILKENSYHKSAQHPEGKPPNMLVEKQRNNRMTLGGFRYLSAGKAKEKAPHLEVVSRLLGNKATSSRHEADPAALNASDRGMNTLPRAHTANHFGFFGSRRSPEDPMFNRSDNDNDEPRNRVAKLTDKIASHLPSLPKPSLPYKNKRKALSISTPLSDGSLASPKVIKILGLNELKKVERSEGQEDNLHEFEETIAPKLSRRERSFSTNDLSNIVPKSPIVHPLSATQSTQPLGVKKNALAALDTADPGTQQYLEHVKRANLKMPKEFNLPALTTNMLEDPNSNNRPTIEKNGSDKIYSNGIDWVEPQDRPQERHAGASAPLDDSIIMCRKNKGRMMNLLPITMEFTEHPARVRESVGIQENACESPMDDIAEAQADATRLSTEQTSSPRPNFTSDSVHHATSQGRGSRNDGESAYSGTNEFPDMHSTPRNAYDASSRRQAIRLNQSPLKVTHRIKCFLSRYDVDEDMADDFYEDAYGPNTFAGYYRQDLHPADDEMEDDTLTVASYYNDRNRLSTVPEEKRVSDADKHISDPIKRSSVDAGLLIEELNPKNKRLKLKIRIPEFYRRPVHLFENYEDIIQGDQREYGDWYKAINLPYETAASNLAAESNLAEQAEHQAMGPPRSSNLTPFPSFVQTTSTADSRHSNSLVAFYERTSSHHSSSSSSPRSSKRHSIGSFSKDFLAKHVRRNSTMGGRTSVSRHTSTSLMAATEMEKTQLAGNFEEKIVGTEAQEPREGKEDNMADVDAPLSFLYRMWH